MVGCMFVVAYCTKVDHPELRDASYPIVPAGRLLPTRLSFATQGAAVRFAESLMAGEEDFGSEFVISVQVLKMREGRSPRVVRCGQRRTGYERDGAWRRAD